MRVRAVLGIATLLVTGCKLNTDYFKDYRGVNLLSNYGFDAAKPAPASGVQWGLESYASYSTVVTPTPYDPTDYMSWGAASDLSAVTDTDGKTLSQGPDGTSPAYRLEIKNLLKDGDLKSLGPAGPTMGPVSMGEAWWSLVNSATTVKMSTSAVTSSLHAVSYSPISSKSLFFSGNTGGNQLALKLDATSVPLWGRPGGYRFRFDFRYTGDLNLFNVGLAGTSWAISTEDTEGGGVWNATGLTKNSATIVAFSRYFAKDNTSTAATLTFGNSINRHEAVIDNVRVIQADIEPYVKASLPLLGSGSATLLPGAKTGDYELSFWVHDDPTADQTSLSGIAHVSNRLEPSGVTIRVTAAVKSGSGTYVSFVARPSAGWPTWTQLTFPMGFDFVNSNGSIPTNGSALLIEISPTNTVDQSTNGRDAGSVLVAQPVFTFNP